MGGKGKGRFKWQHHVAPKRQLRGFPDGGFDYPGPGHETQPLTMQQEALNTERHAFARSTVQLRHHQVTFVSAGNLVRDDLEDSTLENVNQSLKDLSTSKPEPVEDLSTSQHIPDESLNDVGMSGARSPPQQGFQDLEDRQEDDLEGKVYVIDVTGDERNCVPNEAKPEVRPRSPTPEESSEDEVVFVGRNKSKARQHSPNKWSSTRVTTTQQTRATVQDTTQANESTQGIESREEFTSKREAEVPQSTFPAWAAARDFDAQDESEINIDLRNGSKRRQRRGRRSRYRRQEMDEDLILADYIANMRNDESSEDQASEASINVRPLSQTKEVEQEYSKSIQQQRAEDHAHRSLSWSSNDLDDFNNLSTSDDIPEEVGRIFSKRRRGVEVQYLVTGKNQVPDEARWILREHLIMTGAGEQIKAFEETEGSVAGFSISSEDSDSESAEEDRLAKSDAEGEDFPGEGRAEAMSDEQLARLLDKQEKFGLAADDWHWTQNSDSDHDPMHNVGLQPGSFTKKKKKGSKKGQFPSASAFADALDEDPYHGFDIMDFDRPSLRKKSKRGHQTFGFGLSDSEMEWNLHQAWENDRTKKKAKKREREELRAQGLLGKASKRNGASGFSDSMGTDDVKDRIRAFLLSSSESLSFPPMDKRDRKLVHDLANAVTLKSQSKGNGTSRFTMLFKTARTMSFDRKSIGEVDRIFSSRRFMRQMGGGGKRKMESSAGKSVKPRRTGANAAASHMDGEVVGASAPEIGIENKGRAMLEKMGWSTGTALGATDNKGILQPLAQVVKNSKAGLG